MRKTKKIKTVTPNSFFEFVPQSELDFHNLGELTTYDIEKYLNEFLEDCYINKLSRVLVVTGKGLIVRPLVLRLLRNHKYVDGYKPAGYFNGQSGAVEIELVGE